MTITWSPTNTLCLQDRAKRNCPYPFTPLIYPQYNSIIATFQQKVPRWGYSGPKMKISHEIKSNQFLFVPKCKKRYILKTTIKHMNWKHVALAVFNWIPGDSHRTISNFTIESTSTYKKYRIEQVFFSQTHPGLFQGPWLSLTWSYMQKGIQHTLPSNHLLTVQKCG